MRKNITLCLALVVLGSSATAVMAQTGPAQPQTTPPAAAPAGNAASVLPAQGGNVTTVQGQTTVTSVQGGLVQSDIGINFGKRFDCGHVIEMLIRKAHLAQFGGNIQPAPVVFGGFYGDVVVQPKLGDLELGAVGMVADATPDTAPIYSVTICNKGDIDVGCFYVSAVAVLGEIHEFSPITTIKVPKLCAGESVCVELQIPFAAMAMGNANHRCAFDKMVVAIDAFDNFIECDECNNIAVFQRDAVVLIEKTETTTETTTTEAVVEESGAEEIPPSVDNSAAAPSAPAPDKTEDSPLDNFDIDDLDLTDAEGTRLLGGSVFK